MKRGERKAIARLIRVVAEFGWKPGYLYNGNDDGEHMNVKNWTPEMVIEEVNATDESTITFVKNGCANMGVLLVLGNDPSGVEVASDWNVSPKNDFEKAMEKFGKDNDLACEGGTDADEDIAVLEKALTEVVEILRVVVTTHVRDSQLLTRMSDAITASQLALAQARGE